MPTLARPTWIHCFCDDSISDTGITLWMIPLKVGQAKVFTCLFNSFNPGFVDQTMFEPVC